MDGEAATTVAPPTGLLLCASTMRPEMAPVVCAAADAARSSHTAIQGRIMRKPGTSPDVLQAVKRTAWLRARHRSGRRVQNRTRYGRAGRVDSRCPPV